MELVYLYIKNYGKIFENVGFNFSDNYTATFDDNNRLLIEENKKSIKKYYGENINNISMIFGKNGVGKTTLLNILGMNRDDRCSDTYKGTEILASYFILYHLYDDYFGIEFVDYSYLDGDNRIGNIRMDNFTIRDALYKTPITNIFKYVDGELHYSGNIIRNWLRDNNCKNKLEYAYITSDRYNKKINNRYRQYGDDYSFERRYYLEQDRFQFIYKYFLMYKHLINEAEYESKFYIKNKISVDLHVLDLENKNYDYLYNKKQQLDELLGVPNRFKTIFNNKNENRTSELTELRSNKEKFLDEFYALAIEYYFLEELVGWSRNEGVVIDTTVAEVDVNNLIFTINQNGMSEKNVFMNGTGELQDFQHEYALLLYKIGNSRLENGKIDLKAVLEYTLNRVTVAASGTIDIVDRNAVFELADLIEKLPDAYFVDRKTICIDCGNDQEDAAFEELLTVYDYYYGIRNSEQGSNRIANLIDIIIPSMSEGQNILLEIISKANAAIESLNPGDSIVLLMDEPDKSLHPEWARRFLNDLLKSINMHKDKKVQIILTSHSPFIVTDILPEFVYSIQEEGEKRIIENDKNTYATNIYYLLMDSFMLENTFGEYSYSQIKGIIDELRENEDIEPRKLQRMKAVIDRIGEKAIKKQIMQLYSKKIEEKADKRELMNMLSQENSVEKLERIREILLEND